MEHIGETTKIAFFTNIKLKGIWVFIQQLAIRVVHIFLLFFVIGNVLVVAANQNDNEVAAEYLSIGILPHLESRTLIESYLPLIRYLEQTENIKVSVKSAPSFPEYFQRTLDGHYSLYITAPHFAAQNIEKGDIPLLMFARKLQGEIYVRKSSPINTVADLKNQVIATPPRDAVISLLGVEELDMAGLESNINITVRESAGHDNALKVVIGDRATAAIAAAGTFESLSFEEQSQLRLIKKTRRIPHVVLMQRGDSRREILRDTLKSFTNQKENKLLGESTGFGPLVIVSEREIQEIRSLLSLVKKRLL